MQDRNRDVRHHAEEMYAELVQHVDLNFVNRAIRDLKPAELKGISLVLDKCASNVGKRMSSGSETSSSIASSGSSLDGIDAPVAHEEKKKRGPRRVKKKVEEEEHHVKKPTAEKRRPGSRLRLKRASSAPPRTPTKADPAIPSQDGILKGFLFRVNDQKDAREKKEQKKRWSFEEPREEFVDLLREQMGVCVSDELLEKMFSSNFKDHVEAVDFLSSTCTEEYYSVILQCLDCILKWISLRLFDMNTAPVLRSTQYLLNLFSLLHKMGYNLSTYEADVIFPYVAEKCGSNNTAIRENMRLILRKGMEVVLPVKLTMILARHLRTKNFRSRVEIMDVIQDCIFAFGQDVLLAPSLSKLLPAIGRYLDDRESSVRDAAVRVFVAAHSHLDDELFDQVKFPAKVADSVTEKVRKDSAALKDAAKGSTEPHHGPSLLTSPLGKHTHARPGNLVFKHRRKLYVLPT
jgi:cytoskeleton-associated protein 5